MMIIVKCDAVHLVIDDALTLRAAKEAPGRHIHHQHGNKTNLAQFVRGQWWDGKCKIFEPPDRARIGKSEQWLLHMAEYRDK